MFQEIEGHHCYVIDMPVFPPPMPIHDGGHPELKIYAEALNAAIETGQIRRPGKYGVELYYKPVGSVFALAYNIYEVKD